MNGKRNHRSTCPSLNDFVSLIYWNNRCRYGPKQQETSAAIHTTLFFLGKNQEKIYNIEYIKIAGPG